MLVIGRVQGGSGLHGGSFFFFSSRRRHTRYWRDWSSDVCSSDLVLVRTLKAAGAQLSWCGCNPLSTQDDVAASLAQDEDISVFASRGVTQQEYYDDIHSAMMLKPHVTIDDGADLTVEMHKENFDSLRS